ncbi:uncharacterized protein DS421_3g100900 [Arachis hypogaea]|nr:uncharacterized protein DS421_3g100900 [Arachis hypogaea]
MIKGDDNDIQVVADEELAHSWTGNLIRPTNIYGSTRLLLHLLRGRLCRLCKERKEIERGGWGREG